MPADRTIRASFPTPTFRQAWLIRSCWAWGRGDMRSRYWTLTHAVRIAPALDSERLRRSIHQVLATHEALRWTFYADGDDVAVKVLPPDAFILDEIDARDFSPAEMQARLETQALDVIEPDGGPLAAFSVYQTQDASVLLLRFHHALVDAWSIMVMIRELVLCYVSGKPPEAHATSNFSDFVSWQQRFVESDRGQEQLAFWQEYLSDLPPPLRLPYDRPDAGTFTSGAYVSRPIDAGHAAALIDRAHGLGISPFRLLLAAFNLTIYAMAGAPDAPVACAVSNRARRGVLQTIGWVANNVHFRTIMDPDNSMQDYWHAVSLSTARALENQDYPACLVEDALFRDFPGLASALDQISIGADVPSRIDEAGTSEAMLQAGDAPLVWGGYSCEVIALPSLECNRDLTLVTKYRANAAGAVAIEVSLNFRGDVFERRTAEEILELYAATLEQMLASPDAPVRDVIERLRNRFPRLTANAR